MQRELKYKIWLPYCNTMMQPVSIIYIQESQVSGVTIGQMKQWVWLEYTGLKDKNGEEVYHGDILRDTLTKMTYTVKFGYCKKEGFTGWYAENEGLGFVTALNGDYDTNVNSQIEIIGNINQKPIAHATGVI